MPVVFPFILLLAIFIEGSITTLPVVLLCLLLYVIRRQQSNVFWYALVSGLILDSMQFRPIGLTSIFFCFIFLFVLLYQRKFEISSFPFILVAVSISGWLYLFLFIHTTVLLQTATLVGVTCVLIVALRLFGISLQRKHTGQLER